MARGRLWTKEDEEWLKEKWGLVRIEYLVLKLKRTEGLMARRHANEFLRTSSGRLAGNGMVHDRYDEESGNDFAPPDRSPKHSKKYVEARKKLKKSPVKTYKITEEELKKY